MIKTQLASAGSGISEEISGSITSHMGFTSVLYVGIIDLDPQISRMMENSKPSDISNQKSDPHTVELVSIPKESWPSLSN